MKIAVLGGGTAGFIASAHLTRNLPQAELLHLFDSRIPTIGVGEGTTPRFPSWFEEVTGLGFSDLAERCRATLKKGLRFEGWGNKGSQFLNRFQPTRLIGYHFDAADLVRVLEDYVRADRIDARVEDVRTLADGVRVQLEGETTHVCDYVFDARGFPRSTNGGHGVSQDFIQLDWIPTGRAMLRKLPPGDLSGVTRAVARPHGWIFQIPLRGSTSCGYIFNHRINSDAEVAADFTEFLQEEGVTTWNDRGMITFPNFVRHRVCDGRVFWLGNAAAFLEPLEATAICTAIVEVRAAAHLILDHGSDVSADPGEVEKFNRAMRSYVIRNSLFLAWHYACGSRWDTPFWQYARRGIERARSCEMTRPHLADMEEFLEAGRTLPGLSLPEFEDQDRWDREVYPLLSLYRPFGNFSELNFAQVGHGIGYYNLPHTNGAAIVENEE
jgi:2-polyprenyl-6-methoxyphenol hydroxylase-like FAD-dependent oxidoreductase